MSVKSDQTEFNKRVERCLQWIIVGWSAYRITQYITANEELEDGDDRKRADLVWNVNERQVYEYCKKAHAKLEETLKPQRQQEFAKAVLRYNEIFRLALEKGDLNAARRAQGELDKLSRVKSFVDDTANPASTGGIKLSNGQELEL